MPPELALTEPADPRVPPGNGADPSDDSIIIVEDDASDSQSQAQSPAAPDPAIEAEALRMGWTPKDKFKGDPRLYVDAAEYVEKGRTVLPIIRAQLDRTRHENADLRERLAALETANADFQKFRESQHANEQSAAEVGIRAQMKVAQENGDYETMSELTEKLVDLKVAKKTAPAKAAPVVDAGAQRTLLEFANDNPWVKDKDLASAMAVECKNLRAIGENSNGRDFLDLAADRVRRMYPERFERKRVDANMADNDGSSGGATRATGTRSYGRLKPEYRATCDDMVAKKDLTQAQFLASCGPEAFR